LRKLVKATDEMGKIRKQANSESPVGLLVSKRVFVENFSYENEFDLYENELTD